MGTIDIVGNLIFLLLIATITHAACKKLKLPLTIVLVIMGLLIGHSHYFGLPISSHINIKISPDIIMYALLPTLIFESAFNIEASTLKRHIVPILSLAIVGLLVSTFIIGFIVYLLSPFNLITSLLLGSILSATDPVAVIALFRQLGAPKKLTVLVEGESLFNDATAVVMAKLLFVILMSGAFGLSDISHSITLFIWEFVGGLVCGWLIARLTAYLLGKIQNDLLLEISLTLLLAYASFLIAQQVFHVSGIMATVAAGVIIGSYGKAKISHQISHFLKEFWEYLAFLANALIFLLVGLSVNLAAFNSKTLLLLLIVCSAMLISRLCVVYGLIPIVSKLPSIPKISSSYKKVIFWGGLRGAIALAIVLSLGDFPYADDFLLLVTGAVLFTLIVQGFSMEWLVNKLKLNKPSINDAINKAEGELSVKQHVLEKFSKLQTGGLFSSRVASTIFSNINQAIKTKSHELEQLQQQVNSPRKIQQRLALKYLHMLKTDFYKLYSSGFINEKTYLSLNLIIDAQIETFRLHFKLNARYQSQEHQHYLRKFFIHLLHKLPYCKKIAHKIMAHDASSSYPIIWAEFQACSKVLDQIHKEKDQSKPLRGICEFFESWRDYTQAQLDNLAELYPQYVISIQRQLAESLILSTEKEMLHEQKIAGIISEGIAEKLEHQLDTALSEVQLASASSLQFDATKYLRNISFFKKLHERQLKAIEKLLREHIYDSDEVMIREGEKGTSLYLIMHGVVRVTKIIDGKEVNLATLVSGDFFGEMALLHSTPRTATCTAITPCSVYQLNRKEFEKLLIINPEIEKELIRADQERTTKND